MVIDSVVTANTLSASSGSAPGRRNLHSFPITVGQTVVAGNQPDQCFGC